MARIGNKWILIIIPILIASIAIGIYIQRKHPGKPDIFSIEIDSRKHNISFHLKDENGLLYKRLSAVKDKIENNKKTLVMATNGGMFDENCLPIGLYIEEGKLIKPINRKIIKENTPNFYLQPNGVFYISGDNVPVICETNKLMDFTSIKYATQSGPMLVIGGKINSIFGEKSENYEIRSGVGITKDQKIIFAISNNRVNFYSMAKYFKGKGCINALFLDGFVSELYSPKYNRINTCEKLGVIIAVTEK
jgi:uncharacterized protein YigE (DUF2233 family)